MTKVGCYGSVLYHDPDGRRCSVCPVLADCKEQVAANRIKLDAALDALKKADKTTAKARKRAVATVVAASEPIKSEKSSATTTRESKPAATASDTSGLNVKVREFVVRWESKGLDFTSYQEGVNPFVMSGNKFAIEAMRLLMEKGSCTKKEMVDWLIDHAGARGPWGCGTAASHANIVFEAFEHLGIIAISGSTAYLRGK